MDEEVKRLEQEIYLLKARIAELEEERRWIPVGERLPDCEVMVLAICRLSEPFIAYMDGDEWWMDGDSSQAVSVTMWMDLPAGYLEGNP